MFAKGLIVLAASTFALSGCDQRTEPASEGVSAVRSNLEMASPASPGASAAEPGGETKEFRQQAAEGEEARMRMPAQNEPMVTVGLGEACGKKDTNGAMLTCAVGTYCMQQASDSDAKCVNTAPGRPSDG